MSESTPTGVTRAEYCAIACAEVFRGDGEVMASAFGTAPALGARLARLTFAPDLVLTDGDAALVRLADILAHYAHGTPVSPADMLRVARTAGVGSGELRAVLFALPQASGVGKRRVVEACPLSVRERDVLRLLAEGKVYKQIASELTLSTSTVRTHLHNVYGKLGAVDRAQAVLIATERGWL